MAGRIRVARVPDSPLWAISSTYFSPALVEHGKAVPGMTFEGATRSWRGYADAAVAVCARLATRNIHVDGAEDLPHPDDWKKARTPFLFSTQGLREYQVEGVRFLIARAEEGALLADGMRLGKSLMATVAARAFKQKTLVVCPSHIVGVWGRPPKAIEGPGEIAKWWPDAWKADLLGGGGVMCLETVKPFKAQILSRALREKKVLTLEEEGQLSHALGEIEERAAKLAHVNVIICHYDILYAWVDVLIAWGMRTLILDEVHIVAGWQSRRSDALKTLRLAAKRTIGLTGTPVTNRPKQLHNVLDLLAPMRFGYFFTEKRPGSFSSLYCDSFQKTVGDGEHAITVWDHSGKSNLDEPDQKTAITKEETLHARLQFLMLRRLKKDVDPQLPVKQRQIVDVIIPANKTVYLSTESFGKGGKELRRALDLAADAKLKAVVELVASHAAEEETTLCFCYRRLFAERVASDVTKKVGEKVKVVFIHGGLTQKERDRRIHKLREHCQKGGTGVLACTIDTAATGIDLSFASVAVVAELTWQNEDLVQLEERVYAYGKDTKALIQYVIARGTGDELILRGVINSLDTAERLIGSSGDRMKEDLAQTKEDPMKKLYAALVEMQQAPGVVIAKKRRKKVSSS